jgi:two-component system OmpR family sensor kinase
MGRLFWKFFLSILLAQLIVTLGVGAAFWVRDQARAKAAVTLDASPPARFMTEAAAATLRHGGPDAMRALLATESQRKVYAVDETGRDILGREVRSEWLRQARTAQQGPDIAVRHIDSGGHRYVVFMPYDGPRRPDGMRHGPDRPPTGGPGPGSGFGPPHGGRPMGGPPLHNYLMGQVGPLIGATLASLVFAGFLAWTFARPIRALRHAFEAASGGDLAPRFSALPGRRDELADLGHDFDRMSLRLRALMEGQRRLLHDVSHELRAPLARLQAAVGLAHQQPDKAAAALERIERETVRMDRLVDELLTLSRLDAGGAQALDDDIVLAELVDEIAGDARFEAQALRRNIVQLGESRAVVRGASTLLWRAIENVVRNAIKHSPEGGVIEIALRDGARDDGAPMVHLTVADRGPGIREADLEAVFQPFFRSDPDGKVDGHGLGLAIAQRVVQAHGGTIGAANRRDGGLMVEIVLPAHAPA